ncbi:hypothetical protein [Streptomyces sp. NPDC004528]|uniref:hypothetical protein n=1 Tax=Streptomyces sp. NPDC004528 TaxID=3154550 RepID=UPI0033A24867
MVAKSAPRLTDSAEIAAEHGLTVSRINGLYAARERNGFPEAVDSRGRARLWIKADVDRWFNEREISRFHHHVPPARDPEDLLNASESSRYLGYKNPMQVTIYTREHPGYFPEPDVVEDLGTAKRPYRRKKWRVRTLDNWMSERPGKGKHTGAMRTPPPLPDVPVDGDPEELLGATQTAALLGFKSVNSFSSSLSQGNLPLLKTADSVSENGRRRRWTRRRVLEQRAQRTKN